MKSIALFGVLAALVAAWFYQQTIIDYVRVQTFSPSSSIAAISRGAQLSDHGEFLFYASQPSLEGSNNFNAMCKRQEATSPILGCYNGQQIVLYDITNQTLDGIEEVTAAHEMLHAAWLRLSAREQAALQPKLEAALREHMTDDLKERMEYYERTEPGEVTNELHSIIGTEIKDLDNDLEDYYAHYFDDRMALVSRHEMVQSKFDSLQQKADQLTQSIRTLAASINTRTQSFNQQSASLDRDIATFNRRAQTPGGYSSQSEFDRDRAALQARSAQLNTNRSQLVSDIATYNSLVDELNSINAESSSLYKSIDSTLNQAPAV